VPQLRLERLAEAGSVAVAVDALEARRALSACIRISAHRRRPGSRKS